MLDMVLVIKYFSGVINGFFFYDKNNVKYNSISQNIFLSTDKAAALFSNNKFV